MGSASPEAANTVVAAAAGPDGAGEEPGAAAVGFEAAAVEMVVHELSSGVAGWIGRCYSQCG